MVLTAVEGGAGVAGAPRPHRHAVRPPRRGWRGPGGAGRPAPRRPGPSGPRPRGPRRVPARIGARIRGAERGSQTLEFALLLPCVALLLVVGLHAGLIAADLVRVQGLAREAARTAAVADDSAVRAALQGSTGGQPFALTLTPPAPRPPGTLVTAEVQLASRGFRALGSDVWLPARAVTRVEDR